MMRHRIIALLLFGFMIPAHAASPAADAAKCTATSGSEAIDACSRAIESKTYSGKDLSVLYANRGSEYRGFYEYGKALEDLDKAIQIDPANAIAFHDRCAVYNDTNRFDQAVPDCTEAIRLKPKSDQNANVTNQNKFDLLVARAGYNAFYNRGIAWRGKGDLDRAVADFTEAIRQDPNHDGAYNNRGMSFQALGDYDRAITDYTETIRLQPNDFRGYFNRGRTWAVKGEFRRAISDYDEAIKRMPRFNQLYRARGAAHYALKEYPEASEDLGRSLEISENAWVMLWRYLARARLSQNGAPELVKNAAKLGGSGWPNPITEFFLGRRSLESMRAAAETTDQKCQAEFFSGEWHSLHGKTEDAKRAWQAAANICRRYDCFEYEGATAELKQFD